MPKVLNRRTDTIPKEAVYIGRPSKWGNPFVIGKDGTREQVIAKYREYLYNRPRLKKQVLEELSGKDLVCFCAPKSCHGDILLQLANRPAHIDWFRDEYDFLSNFHYCKIRAKSGLVYRSAEHAYQAAKTRDPELRAEIAALQTAKEAKSYGKRLRVRKNWDALKFGIMLKIVRSKFRQNPELAERLIATGDLVLIEGNWWGDTYWGVCRGVGENNLGKILMQIRDELVKETK